MTTATPAQQDDYIFTLTGPARLYFDSFTANIYLYWSLTGPRGTEVSARSFTNSDSAGIGGNPVLDLMPGTYRVQVAGSGTGSYSFRLLDVGGATAITPGTVVAGTLDPGSETDAYQFTALAGDRFYFDAQSYSGTYNDYWRLLDPYGGVVFGPSYFPYDVDVLTLNFNGTYTLLLEGYVYDSAPASYSFNIQPVSDDAASLVVGALVSGSIAHAGQLDRYTFTLGEATKLYFDSLSADPSISWSLSGPRGTEVSSRSFVYSDSATLSGNPILDLLAGDYTLTVDGSLDATGAYAFRLLDVESDASAITPGAVVAGTLDPGNETDAYRFTALAGDRFYFDAQSYSGTYNEYWRLLDPYGGVVFGPSSFPNDVDVLTLELSGTYTLLLEGYVYGSTPESYAFNIQPVSDDAASLAVGAPVSGSIAHTGQLDRYSFTLGSATQLYFDSLSADPSLSWSLSGPRGTEVLSRSFVYSDSVTLSGNPVLDLLAGDYTLIVDGSLDATGVYDFRLLDVGGATAITPGTVIAGTLDPGNETDAYQFTALAGDQFYFDSQSSTVSAYWRLLDPYGGVVFGPSYFLYDVDVLTLELSGTYTLLLEGYVYGSTPESYQFNVEPRGHTDLPPLTGTEIAIGSTVNGEIATPGQQDDYIFTLTGPARLYFDSFTANI